MNLLRHPHQKQRGSALVEITMSYSVLVVLALLALRASVNTTTAQAWTIKQTMCDGYISREAALASRIPFDTAVSNSSQWPAYPSVKTDTVTIGRLPGGNAVMATLHRTRMPHHTNLPAKGGTGDAESNPIGAEAWQLQSILSYDVGGRQYVKSRTVLRFR